MEASLAHDRQVGGALGISRSCKIVGDVGHISLSPIAVRLWGFSLVHDHGRRHLTDLVKELDPKDWCSDHTKEGRRMMARNRSILYLTNKGLQLDLSAHALSKLFARYEIFKMVLNLPGDIVDCGVYRGASLFSWGNLIEIFAPHSQKVVIGFDTFSGFSSDLHIVEDRDNSAKLMEDRTRFLPRSMEEITSVANMLNLSHRFRLISGDAVKTIPEFVQENRGLRFSLLNLDFDVYEPTAAALKYLLPLLVPGGIVILDEYGNKGWGESDAVDTFFAGQAVRFERFGWSAGPGAYFVKQTPG